MKKLPLIFLLSAIILLQYSCGDDDSSGPSKPGTDNLIPEGEANWWVYATYNLDTLDNRTEEAPVYDSTVFSGFDTKVGKQAKIYSSMQLPYNPMGLIVPQYYAEESEKVYIYSGVIYDFLPLELPFELPNNLTENWLLVCDPNGTEWTAFEHTYNNDTITIDGFGSAILNGKLRVKVKNDGFEIVEVGNEKINSWKSKVSLEIVDATVQSEAAGNIVIPLTLSRDMYIYFGNNIGITRMKMDMLNANAPLLEIPKFPGTDRILVRYQVMVNTTM